MRGGGKDFYSNFALEFEIGGAIDRAHSAATEFAVESIAFTQDRPERGDTRSQLIRKDARLGGIIGPIIGHISFDIYHLSFEDLRSHKRSALLEAEGLQ